MLLLGLYVSLRWFRDDLLIKVMDTHTHTRTFSFFAEPFEN